MDKEMIASKLKKRRKELNLSQKRLSDLSGISQSTISGIEGNRNLKIPGADTLFQLAEVLEVDFEYFFNPSVESRLCTKEDKYLDQDKVIDIIPFFSNESAFLNYYQNDTRSEEYRCVSNHLNITLAMKIEDDTMYPFFLKDDSVFISKDQFVTNKEIGLYVYESKCYIRQYFELKDRVLLRPFNPNFPDMVLKDDEEKKLIKIGKAVFFARILENNRSFERLLNFHLLNL